MAKKKKRQSVDEQFSSMSEFQPEVCKLKHLQIEKEFKNIGDKIDSLKSDVKEAVKEGISVSHESLKDKIILTEKMIGDKLDVLNDFDSDLRGNGHPGVREDIRSLKWKFRISIGLLVIILIIVLGGSYKGVSLDSIKKAIGINTAQVEETPKEPQLDVPPGISIKPDVNQPKVLSKEVDNNKPVIVIDAEPNK